MSSSINSSNKSIPDSAILNQSERYTRSKNEKTSAGLLAQSIVELIESVKNTEIDSSKLTKFKSQLRSLASFCNSKFMNKFPIEIVDMPIENIYFGIKNWDSTDLNLSNAMKFVVDTFYELDKVSSNIKSESSTRCADAILVLIQYVNLVIFSRFDHGLIIQQKKSFVEMHSSSTLVAAPDPHYQW